MAIYSERYRIVLFVAPYTGAGPLVELMLDGMQAHWCPSADVKINYKVVTPRVGTTYDQIVEGKVIHPADLAASFKCTVVRNTYDWLVAMFEQTRPNRAPLKDPAALEARRAKDRQEFSPWLLARYEPMRRAGQTSTEQTMYLDNMDGVIPFDQLEAGAVALLNRSGAEHLLPQLKTYMKSGGGRKATNHRAYYTPEDIELVQQVHGPMIERFGFVY